MPLTVGSRLGHYNVTSSFNQIDKLESGHGEALARRGDGVAVSALERTGLGAARAGRADPLGPGRRLDGQTAS